MIDSQPGTPTSLFGPFQSYDRSGNRHANGRFQSTGAVGRTAARTYPFSKAVADDLAAPFGTRCKPYVRSLISQSGAAGPSRSVATLA